MWKKRMTCGRRKACSPKALELVRVICNWEMPKKDALLEANVK